MFDSRLGAVTFMDLVQLALSLAKKYFLAAGTSFGHSHKSIQDASRMPEIARDVVGMVGYGRKKPCVCLHCPKKKVDHGVGCIKSLDIRRISSFFLMTIYCSERPVMGQDFMLLEALKTFSVNEATPWLGRIVKSYRNPISAYTPEEEEILTDLEQPCEDNHYTDVRMVASKLSSHKIQADFLGLFGFTLESRSTHSRELASHAVQRLRIHNEELVLKRVLQNPSVLQRLDEWGFGVLKPVFMIVGLLIADGISYHEENNNHVAAGIQIDPGQAAAASMGVPFPSASPVRVAVQNETGSRTSLFAAGRRVFAVEYRVFQRKMTSNPWGRISVENTRLRRHGPSGDRTFDLDGHIRTITEASPEESQFEFLDESLDELIDEDAENSYFSIEKES